MQKRMMKHTCVATQELYTDLNAYENPHALSSHEVVCLMQHISYLMCLKYYTFQCAPTHQQMPFASTTHIFFFKLWIVAYHA